VAARFRITNGTDYVDIVGTAVGIKPGGWRPGYAQFKSDGIRRSSPMADGNKLVSASYENVTEVITTAIYGPTQDDVDATIAHIIELLTQAKDYWCSTTRGDIGPVWLERKASQETNTAYALITMGVFRDFGNPFEMPFVPGTCQICQDDVVIQIERGHWMSNPPGEAECVQVSNSHFWSYSEWGVISAAPVLDVNVLFQDSDDTLYAGESTSGGLLRSVNGGATWVAPSTPPAGMEMSMCEDDLGRVYLFTNAGVYRSADNGDNWAQISVAIQAQTHNSICFSTLNKGLYAIDNGGNAYYSADYGVNWTLFSDLGTGLGATGYSIFCVDTGSPSTGVLLIGHNGSHSGSSHIQHWYIYSTTVVPTSVQVVYDNADSTVLSFYQPGDGYVYAGVTGEIYRAAVASMMLSWSQCASGFNGGIYAFTHDDRYYYTTGSARIYFSTNMLNWSYRAVGAATQFYSLVYSDSSEQVFAGEAGDIWSQVASKEVGQIDPSCDGAYVVNYHARSNITHAYVYDAAPVATYTRIFPSAALPVELLPTTPAVGDILYVGYESSHPMSHGHQNLVFDIGTAGLGITGVWEFSNLAAGWTTVDNVVDNTVTFGVTGVNSISFSPSAWATGTVNGVTAYWLRFRVTAIGAVLVAPTQQNREIYATTWPFVEVASTEVTGDIPALAAIEVIDRGDKSGPENNANPERWANFIAAGLRSTSRGLNFSPYLACSYDDQNVPGIDVQVGYDCAYEETTTITYLTTPYRYVVKYDPSESQVMSPRVSFIIPAGLSQEYYGTYHVFVRCYEEYSATVNPEVSIRVKATTGRAGLQTMTKSVRLPHTGRGTGAMASAHLLSLGRLNMPASGIIKASEAGQELTIAIEAASDGGNHYVYFYDLILMPSDEWLGFFSDDVSNLETALQHGQKLLVDSVFNPKVYMRAIGQSSDADEFVKSIWSPDANGPVILQANARQRLWFTTGLSGVVSVADDSGVANKSYFYNSGGFLIAYGVKVGQTIFNLTDGSQGIISAVETTSASADLSGGTDNDFDNGDVVIIFTEATLACFESLYKVKLWCNQRYLAARGAL
jgi:hypothetical protein